MRLVTENGQEGLGMGVREPMTGTPSPPTPSRFLIVTLGGRYLALNAESVCGVLTLEEIGNAENATVHGMVYEALNLADRLNLPDCQGGANARVVLLSERKVHGSLRVTSVQGLLELPPSQVLPLPMLFRGPERQWYRGMILFANSVALVLNTTWVLHERESCLEGSEGQGGTLGLPTSLNISTSESRVC